MKSTTYKLSELLSILNGIIDQFGESSIDWDIELKYLVFPENGGCNHEEALVERLG